MAAACGLVAGPASAPRRATSTLPVAARGVVSQTLGVDDPRMAASAVPGGWAFVNGGVHAQLTRAGAVVRAAGTSWSLGLRAVGGHAVRSAVPSAHSNRVTFARGAVREWYANGPLGLEQGFTVLRPVGGGPLTLDLGRLPAGARVQPDRATVGALTYGGLVAADSRGRSLPARMERAGNALRLRVDARDARYPVLVDPFVQAGRLTTSDGAASDNFGWAVAVSDDGDTIVAGAPYATIGANDQQGAAYVFTRPAGGWATGTQVAKLTSSDGAAGDFFGGSVAIAGDGSTIVVGSPSSKIGSNTGQGAAYVYVKPGGGWATTSSEAAKLTADPGAADDGLGSSVGVAYDGATIAAGAPNANGQLGRAYVFARPGGGWADGTQTATLSPSDGAFEDSFAVAISISGDGSTIAAGAPFAVIATHTNQGAAYVFTRPQGGWSDATEDGKLTATGGAAYDVLGDAIALSRDGSTIAAGANDAIINDAQGVGEVYVFTKPGGGWSDTASVGKLTASDGAQYDTLGTSVAISPDGATILAGASQAAISGHLNQGAAYLFDRPATGWADEQEALKLSSSDGHTGDRFGDAVALAGAGTAAVGAQYSQVGSNDAQGSAYVFVAPTTTTVTCAPTAVRIGESTTCTATVSGGATPTGSVGLGSDSAGTGGSCSLVSGSCQVAYTPAAVGSGTHTLTATYSSDGGHATSQGTTTLGVTAPPGGGGGAGGGGETHAPVAKLTAAALERIAHTRAVVITVTSDTAGTFVAHGTLTVPGAAKVFTLRGATGSLAAGVAKKIRLLLSKREVAAVKRALKRHRKVTAHATVRVRNAAGATTVARTIRAKR